MKRSDLFAPDRGWNDVHSIGTRLRRGKSSQKKVTNFHPHPKQREFLESPARFRIATCGRRWGKTLACAKAMVDFAKKHPGAVCWWVAPFYKQTKIGYRLVSRATRNSCERNLKSELRIELKNGSVIEFRSADRADSLRGEGVSFLVVDEAAMMRRDSWEEELRATLSDKAGKAMLISTPKGRNWFFELFARGQDPAFPDYESFQFPTESNPYIPKKEVEEAKQTLPHDVYQQEYQAQFLEESAGVFRGIRNCIQGKLESPQPGGRYVCGWDVAKHSDYSVITVLDVERRHLVYFDRFNQVDWSVQLARLESVVEEYDCKVIMDSTGVGDALLEAVESRGIDVEGFKFTNTSKTQLVQNLSLMIERRELTFPDIPVLINELMIFQYEVSSSGNFKYSAPAGAHDDAVMSLGLAAWGLKEHAPMQLFI